MLVTTFFRPPVREERPSLHAPTLRAEVLGATPERGDHLLVYQTAEGNDSPLETLQRSGLECRVCGMRRGTTEELVEGGQRFSADASRGAGATTGST